MWLHEKSNLCKIGGRVQNVNLCKTAELYENRGSYMSAHVLLNLLNELRKSDEMRGLPSI